MLFLTYAVQIACGFEPELSYCEVPRGQFKCAYKPHPCKLTWAKSSCTFDRLFLHDHLTDFNQTNCKTLVTDCSFNTKQTFISTVSELATIVVLVAGCNFLGLHIATLMGWSTCWCLLLTCLCSLSQSHKSRNTEQRATVIKKCSLVGPVGFTLTQTL